MKTLKHGCGYWRFGDSLSEDNWLYLSPNNINVLVKNDRNLQSHINNTLRTLWPCNKLKLSNSPMKRLH